MVTRTTSINARGKAAVTMADLAGDQGDPNTWAIALLSAGAVNTGDLVRDSADNLYLSGMFYQLTSSPLPQDPTSPPPHLPTSPDPPRVSTSPRH